MTRLRQIILYESHEEFHVALPKVGNEIWFRIMQEMSGFIWIFRGVITILPWPSSLKCRHWWTKNIPQPMPSVPGSNSRFLVFKGCWYLTTVMPCSKIITKTAKFWNFATFDGTLDSISFHYQEKNRKNQFFSRAKIFKTWNSTNFGTYLTSLWQFW